MRHRGQDRCTAALMVMVRNRSVGRHERRAEQGGGGWVAETGRRIWTQCGQEENLLAARFRPFMVAAAVRSAAGTCSGQMHRRNCQFVIAGATGPPAPT